MIKNKLSISKGNSKLQGINNFSLPPVKSCPNCSFCFQTLTNSQGKKIKLECYAMKAYKSKVRQNVRKAWDKNFNIAQENLEKFYDDMVEFLKHTRKTIFRIHVSGDFFSQAYLEKWFEIIRLFPNIRFLTFTKAFSLDFSNKPINLIVYASIMPNMAIPLDFINRFNTLQAFCDIPENYNPTIATKCPGSCAKCQFCWSSQKNVFFAVH